MQFEYYVLNYNFNKKKVEPFNIFCNIYVQEQTENAVRKYLINPKKYTYKSFDRNEVLYGFDALVKEIDNIIKWQEYSRREYEVSVGDAFETDHEKFEKWDCYQQCVPNIEMITREAIRKYKEYKKEKIS